MYKNTIISESYNLAVEAGFNDFLEKYATFENSEIKIDEEKLIAEIEIKWLNEKIPEIGDITPSEYINSIVSLEELVGLFIDIATVSDVGVPDILVDRLKQHDKPAADMLFDTVQDLLEAKDESKSLPIAQAVCTIGCLRFDEYKNKLIELLITCYKNEMISEAICVAIAEYEHCILEEVFKAFETTEIEAVKEFLLICVAEISKVHQSDEIFYFMKNAFGILSNKKLTVEVLGDYGDGRAIPLLRGYILKNINEIDKDTFNLIRAIIKKLGGEIKDLVLQ